MINRNITTEFKLHLIYLLCLLSYTGFGQSLVEPVFKNETALVNKMLSDSLMYYNNDTLTISVVLNTNGSLKSKKVFYHPEGVPNEQWLFSYLNYAEISYDENGQITSYIEWLNNKNHGDYITFDNKNFFTHWVFENGKLVDVKNDNCRFLDPMGKVITKEEFFEQFESKNYGQWGYYLFSKEFGEYSDLKCCDFVMYSDKFPIPGEGKSANKLTKRLNKSCN